MNTVTAKHMKELDRKTIEEYKIPSIVLMENAGIRTADIIHSQFGQLINNKSILVICGRGNNGGDGFVVARHLVNKGYIVHVIVLANKHDIKGDPLINLTILEKMKLPIYFTEGKKVNAETKERLAKSDLFIDAIFGTGLDRNIDEPFASYIDAINNSRKPVVSIDTPSGLDCDNGSILGIAIKAYATVTMAIAKKGFFIGEGPQYTGCVHVVDISIPKILIDAI